MQKSKCPDAECKSTSGFEAVTTTISGYGFPVVLVQCKKCGTVVGTALSPEIAMKLHQFG